jgi:cellulose synthase/poly-beta-1,6-N-acetylglucosamine synthase-like glycosyltransferase
LFEKFLVEDAQKVHYLKSEEAIVTTFPVGSVLELIHQRVRWASKTTQYAWGLGKYIGLLVALGNLIIALLPLLVCYDFLALHTALSYFLLKLLFDYLLIEKVSRFYAQKIAFSTYLKSSIVYPYFTIAVVLKSLFSSYQWKGRRFKK